MAPSRAGSGQQLSRRAEVSETGDAVAVARVRQLITDEPPQAVDEQAGTLGWLSRLCRAAVRALPASGAGVSVMTGHGAQGVAAASDATSRVLEDLQFVLGEGPCQDAYATRRPVLVPDLSGDAVLSGGAERALAAVERWPGYAPAVHHRGVRAVFAFPLQVGTGRLGVFDVYRDTPGALSARAMTQALVFAEVAVQTLLEGQADAPAGRPVDGLEEAFENRLVVHQAQGMVMVQLGTDLVGAMARLRAHAYATDRRLGDVAADVIARRLIIDSDLP